MQQQQQQQQQQPFVGRRRSSKTVASTSTTLTAATAAAGLNGITSFLLGMQATLRLYHWNTRCHPRHVATDALLSEVLRAGDLIVEAAIGRASTALLPPPSTTGAAASEFRIDVSALDVKSYSDDLIGAYLKTCVGFLTTLETMVPNWEASGIASPRDDLLAAIHRTLYLFRFH
jgi:hypothetical protein